jgi:heme/copper-type cytochrome/quinol oxidase subunit 3
MYTKLAGMTGTAETEKEELLEVFDTKKKFDLSTVNGFIKKLNLKNHIFFYRTPIGIGTNPQQSWGMPSRAFQFVVIPSQYNFSLALKLTYNVYIISYDPRIYHSILIYGLILILSSYISMLFIPLFLVLILFPLATNLSELSSSNHTTEYLYSSLLLFIFLEILLFIAYFFYYFHNYSYSYYPLNQHILLSSNLYIIAGLILSLLSIYLSIILLSIFIILTTIEFSNNIIYINDNPLTIVQLTIVFLHLLHLIVGIILILLELSYPHYYHFIEVIWLLIGYAIYLN